MKRALILLLWALFLAVPGVARAAEAITEMDIPQMTRFVQSNAGKVVMINFFATWCPPCREEIEQLKSYLSKHKDLVVLGMSVDRDEERRAVKSFVAKMGVTWPVSFAGADVVKTFKISSIPFNVFYDPSGRKAIAANGAVEEADLVKIVGQLGAK